MANQRVKSRWGKCELQPKRNMFIVLFNTINEIVSQQIENVTEISMSMSFENLSLPQRQSLIQILRFECWRIYFVKNAIYR